MRHYAGELAFAAGETYEALDRDRRDWWDELSRTVERIVEDEIIGALEDPMQWKIAVTRANVRKAA